MLEYEKTKVPYKRYLIAGIAIILLFGFVSYVYEYYKRALIPNIATQDAPFIWVNNPDIPTSTLHSGEGFWIRISTNRLEVCSVDTEYSVMQLSKRADGNILRKVFYAYPISRNRSIPGQSTTDKYLVLPKWLPIGEYIVTRQSDYDCNGQRLSQDGQPLPISVVK